MAVVSILDPNSPVSDLIKQLGPASTPILRRAIMKSANLAVREWKKQLDASSAKAGWKKRYAERIRSEITDQSTVTVLADGLYANLVEDGVKSWSIKDALLNGPRAKQGKNGRYATVFLRKSTPGTSRSNSLSPAAYSVAKGLSRGESFKNRLVSLAGRIKKGEKVGRFDQRIVSMAEKGIPKDIERVVKVNPPGQTSYGTFYRIGENSDGWQYPDVPAAGVYDSVLRTVQQKVDEEIGKALIAEVEAGFQSMVKGMNK